MYAGLLRDLRRSIMEQELPLGSHRAIGQRLMDIAELSLEQMALDSIPRDVENAILDIVATVIDNIDTDDHHAFWNICQIAESMVSDANIKNISKRESWTHLLINASDGFAEKVPRYGSLDGPGPQDILRSAKKLARTIIDEEGRKESLRTIEERMARY